MPHDDLAMYADALGEVLRHCRWTRQRPLAREALRAMDLTGEQADAVIDHAIERGSLTEQDDRLVPTWVPDPRTER